MRFRLLEWRRRWRETFRHRHDNQMEEELRFQVEMAELDAVRRGQSVREVRLRTGGVTQAAEAVRDQSTIRRLSDFLRDSRHGIRLLARTPVFTAAAILSLALGIGANTAIFSLIDAVVLRMMPVQEPGQLVQFAGGRVLSYPLFRQFGQELHCFTDMFAQSSMGRRDIVLDEEPEAVSAEMVSGRSRSLRGEIPATLYINAEQASRPPTGVYLVRGAGIARIVDSALKRVDGRLRATDVRTLDENLSRSILRERMLGTLSGLFGALSLILVSVGVYGVMAFQVARRQKEIGIRMALGARPVQVIGMVLAETALPVGVGVGMGVAGAFGVTRLAEKMLYGVSPTDPVAFAGASVILILPALLAAYAPSRRAARLSPVETLRCE